MRRPFGEGLDVVMASCSESRTLAALRDTLLPKLISGEFRVNDTKEFSKQENATGNA